MITAGLEKPQPASHSKEPNPWAISQDLWLPLQKKAQVKGPNQRDMQLSFCLCLLSRSSFWMCSRLPADQQTRKISSVSTDIP